MTSRRLLVPVSNIAILSALLCKNSRSIGSQLPTVLDLHKQGPFPSAGYGTGTVGWPITNTCCSRDSHNFNEKTQPQHLAAESLEMDDAEAIAEDIVAESTQRSGGSDHRPLSPVQPLARPLSPVQPLALLASFETPRARHSRRACSTDDAKTPTGRGGTSPKAAASPAANGSPALSLSVLATLSTKTGPSQFCLKPFDLN